MDFGSRDVSLYVTPETPDVTPQICQNCLRSHANFACSKIEMDLTGISNGLDQETINMLEQTVFDSSLLQTRKGTALEATATNLSSFMKMNRGAKIRRESTSVPRMSAMSTMKNCDSSMSISGAGVCGKQKLSVVSNSPEKSEFSDEIRTGNVDSVRRFLANNGPECLNFKLSFEILLRKIPNDAKPQPKVDEVDGNLMHDKVTMYVQPFQLAIISQQSSIVKLILEYSLRGDKPYKPVLKIIEDRTEVDFGTNNIKVFYRDDIALDGMNAIHLATKYDPKSLLIILQFLQRNGILSKASSAIEAKDKQMEMRPLHIAADCSTACPTKMLIYVGADVNAADKRGYTPLHVVARSANEEIATFLLENGAIPNAISNSERFLSKTPLHRASTGRIVQLLLKYGADPYKRMALQPTEFDERKKKKKKKKEQNNLNEHQLQNACHHEGQSVFEVLLQRNPGAAEEILSDGISTNFQDLDSPDLVVVYDLELFLREGGGGPSQCDCKMKKDRRVDEMITHSKIVKRRLRDMLKHPLLETFLHVKWHLTKKFFFVNFFFYIGFLASLTSLAGLQAAMLKCGENSTVICNINHTCTKGHIYNTTNFRDILEECPNTTAQWSYYALFGLTLLGTILLGIREVLQAFFSWKDYRRSYENALEMSIVLLTSAYLVVQLIYIPSSRHFAAWSVFLGWLEMTMLIGRFPNIGIYIYMSIHVIKTLLLFVLVYSPALAAFAFSFYILLPYKEVFDNPLTSGLKVLAMMIGEFEFKDYFIFEADTEGGTVSTQILFVLFLIFVCIVIANLLVGLTVSKTEELFKEAGVIRLEKTVLQIVGQDDVLIKPVGWVPASWRDKFYQLSSVFKYINVSESNDHQRLSQKICVRPNAADNSAIASYYYQPASTFTSTYYDQEHSVYEYDERTCRKGKKLPFKLPGWIVVKTVSLLRQRDGNGGINGIEDNLSGDGLSGMSGSILRSERKSRVRPIAISQILEKSESWDEETVNTSAKNYGNSGKLDKSSISEKLSAIQALVDDLQLTLSKDQKDHLKT